LLAACVVVVLAACGPRFEVPTARPPVAPPAAPLVPAAPAQSGNTTRQATAPRPAAPVVQRRVPTTTRSTATRTVAASLARALPPSRTCSYTRPGPAPLTGRNFDAMAYPRRPILAVKIENSPAAHPHTGLEAADIVVEHVVEGGITRFTAMFHSCVPEAVGPVRSVRRVDPQFLPAYDPLLAFSGGRQEVVNALERAEVATLRDGYAPGFFRLSARVAPHNLYARPAALYRAGRGDAPTAARPAWHLSDLPTRGGPLTQKRVRMSARDVATWTYNPVRKVYRRLQNGRRHRVTGEGRIGPSNVVIMRVKISDGGCCDTSGARYAAIGVTGSGRVQVLRDGVLINGTWLKQTRHHRLRLFDRDGAPLPLKPGRTWIMLAPR
jgi:hypothetical protein